MNLKIDCCRLAALAALALVTVASLPAQEIDRLEFVNAPVREILVALGSATGNSVIPDESVTGTATFYFDETTFDAALASLASELELFVTRTNSLVTVSAIRIETEGEGRFTVDAPSVDLSLLLRRLSREARQPVLFDDLPPLRLAYHTHASTLEEMLTHLASLMPDHELRTEEGAFVFSRLPLSGNRNVTRERWHVERDEDRYTMSAESAGFADLVTALFESGEREYQMLKRSSPAVSNLSFSVKSFDEILTLLCERADAQFTVVGAIYYIMDAAPGAALARAQRTVVVHPNYLPLASLIDALPGEQTAGASLRPDRSGNSVSITGTPQTVDRVVSLIREIDVPPPDRAYHRFTTGNIRISALVSLLPRHLAGLSLVPMPDNQSFVVLATQEQAADLGSFLAMVDLPAILDASAMITPVELEHIQVETLLGNPPASALPGSLIPTGDPGRFFFRGSADELEHFLTDLAAIDQPLPQIRYQLLVVQYEDGSARDFAFTLSNSVSGPDAAQAFLGSLGNLLSLNFDVVAAFGYQFAARLDAQIARSKATVLVDTTISAISGESVRFQNTNTYRYRDAVTSDETHETTPTGVIREITSGLILEINGWVSGSDVVTMDVSATLSKRGTDASNGNPPRTSEKVVDTHIRAESGEPVVLSGLVQQEMQETITETPLLARIPLIGLLFQERNKTQENTELAIYLIPHVERNAAEQPSVEERLMELYNAFTGAMR